MNEKIKKLIEQVNLSEIIDDDYLNRDDWKPFIEQFAEMIIRECVEVGLQSWLNNNTICSTFPSREIKQHFGIK